MAASPPLHVVLGATGGVGQSVVQTLAVRGARVRAVNRSGRGPVPTSVEVMAADLTNRDSTRAACVGATVVYHCAGLPYDQWTTYLPVMLDTIIGAVGETSATLVYTDNCYMYAPTDEPLTEESPQAPVTRKGALRKRLAETLLAAHAQGLVRATIGRAPDFYGPGVRTSAVGEQFFTALVAGKRAPWLGRLDVPHALSYVEDFARGLIVLGEQEQAWGQVWHIPADQALTGRQYVDLASEAAGVQARALAIPALLLYEFTEPYLFDGSKYARAFGGAPTTHVEAMRRTVAWYQALAAPRTMEHAL